MSQSNLIVSARRYCGQSVWLACDGQCNKAWGICARPSIQISEDPDDIVWLADHELGDAPEDPGTYEGGYGKPIIPCHNKWCARQCERSAITSPDRIPALPDWNNRISSKR